VTDPPLVSRWTAQGGLVRRRLAVVERLEGALEGGATIDEIVAALDWRPHTVRGALAGALKKKLGLTITSDKIDPRVAGRRARRHRHRGRLRMAGADLGIECLNVRLRVDGLSGLAREMLAGDMGAAA